MPVERKQIGIRLPADLVDQIAAAAEADHRSVNNWIELVLADRVRGRQTRPPGDDLPELRERFVHPAEKRARLAKRDVEPIPKKRGK